MYSEYTVIYILITLKRFEWGQRKAKKMKLSIKWILIIVCFLITAWWRSQFIWCLIKGTLNNVWPLLTCQRQESPCSEKRRMALKVKAFLAPCKEIINHLYWSRALPSPCRHIWVIAAVGQKKIVFVALLNFALWKQKSGANPEHRPGPKLESDNALLIFYNSLLLNRAWKGLKWTDINRQFILFYEYNIVIWCNNSWTNNHSVVLWVHRAYFISHLMWKSCFTLFKQKENKCIG